MHFLNKQRIIIFEGVDGAGKTTIAKELSKKIKIPYFRHDVDRSIYFQNRIPNEMLFFAHDRFTQFFEKTNYSLICDRGYPSTLVYNQVFGHRKLDENEFSKIIELDDRYSKLNAKIIICFKELNLSQFTDEYVMFKKTKAILNEYIIFQQWSNCKILPLDTTDEDLRSQLKMIIKFIRS